MVLRPLLEKNADADVMRDVIDHAAARQMEPQLARLGGAAHSERSGDRINQRNTGHRGQEQLLWGPVPPDQCSGNCVGRTAVWTFSV